MRKVWIVLLIVLASAYSAYGASGIVRYTTAGAGEGQSASISETWIVVEEAAKVDGKPYQWWRLIMKKNDGSILAIRALSERVPMTSRTGVGDIARYIYSPKQGKALEYIDLSTGKALLPELGLRENLLPRPAPDARYNNGFASTGVFLGHLINASRNPSGCPDVDFSNTKKLPIRTDLIIATGSNVKDDGTPPTEGWGWHFVPLTTDDFKARIKAGYNWFPSNPEIRYLFEDEPVFFVNFTVFPDDLYRSNHLTQGMFIDEPMVRMGWDGGIPDQPSGPEQVAQALRLRVQSQELASKRTIRFANEPDLGVLELFQPKPPAWDTENWAAWYELQGGAPGIIHEGRYVHRGYGYEPESLLGNGLETLTNRDQYNYFYAFMRGAARSFNGNWGTSIYGHSDKKLRLPAMIHAYEMGAKYLWYWTTDHEHHMPFAEQLRLTQEITDYAKKHPRANQKTLLHKADVGIVLPSGYAVNWSGVWGTEREQLNKYGVSYGDIAAAALWQGIICSRSGIEYDMLVDHPSIEKLGYKRLIFVNEDGTLRVTPAWPTKRAPKGLEVKAVKKSDDVTMNNQKTSPTPSSSIARTGKVKIDDDYSDWANAHWIKMGLPEWFGDNVNKTIKVTLPTGGESVHVNQYLGAKIDDLNQELANKYKLEYNTSDSQLVITALEPGSAWEKAGLRVGDMLLSFGEKKLKYTMHVYEFATEHKAQPETTVDVTYRRNGLENYGGDSDLSADVAYMVDDRNLYFAAKVKDDTQYQKRDGWWLWANDSIQLSFDPMLERQKDEYTENNHEIGFVLKDGKPIAWRWNGRRGQPVGIIKDVDTKITRKDGVTLYEAAIPLSVLAPMTPALWSKVGMTIVVNDSDGGLYRKGRLELVPGAKTAGRHPALFKVFEFEPSGNKEIVTGSLVWKTNCAPVGQPFTIDMHLSSAKANTATVTTTLTSLDSQGTKPSVSQTVVTVSPGANHFGLKVGNSSPAGRYRLNVSVMGKNGWKVAEDTLNVYVYPK